MDSRSPELSGRRSGFTLVECLVAIVLVNAGILALMSATTVGVSAALASHRRAAAMQTALNRVDWLLARGCTDAPSSGDTTAAFAPGATERWKVADPEPGVREVRDSVSYPGSDYTREIAVHVRTLC